MSGGGHEHEHHSRRTCSPRLSLSPPSMITTGAIPEREEKTLHSVARMMLADSTRAIPGGGGERRELLAFIADLVEMLREASALVSEGRSLRAAWEAPIVLPSKFVGDDRFQFRNDRRHQ